MLLAQRKLETSKTHYIVHGMDTLFCGLDKQFVSYITGKRSLVTCPNCLKRLEGK